MSETVPVFISWSGEPSRVVAQALATFINDCIQVAAPWTSDDIPKGTAWPDAILTRLQDSAIGIVCVTKANQTSPWLLFEGGALAKHKTLHVFLIDANPADIKPPLGLYQTTKADKAEVLKLLATIDAKVPGTLQRGAEKLRRDCDKNWPELENAIEQARGLLQSATPAPSRSDRELLEEILTTVRGLADLGPRLVDFDGFLPSENAPLRASSVHKQIAEQYDEMLRVARDPETRKRLRDKHARALARAARAEAMEASLQGVLEEESDS